MLGDDLMNEEAQRLFREGVTALRDEKDAAAARKLFAQSLKLEPNNEMGWLWLGRAAQGDPHMQLECVERALKINPFNAQAQAIRARLLGETVQQTPPSRPSPTQAERGGGKSTMQQVAQRGGESSLVKPATQTGEASRSDTGGNVRPTQTKRRIPSLHDIRTMQAHLHAAEDKLKAKDVEGAIEEWVRVLEIQPDHEIAIGNAVKHLSRLGYLDDAKELVTRAIDSGTTHPSIYLTAADIAQREGNLSEADHIREHLANLPNTDDAVIVALADTFMRQYEIARAQMLLENALKTQPDSQKILRRLGDLHKDGGDEAAAMRYYDRVARLGAGTKEGKEAEKRLGGYVPVMTDRERGSMGLAWREAAGFACAFILLAWQDAGLDLLALGVERWVGVLFGTLGGYLLVTAASAPQQQPLAALLGGRVPDFSKRKSSVDDMRPGPIEDPTTLPIIPDAFRYLFGAAGVVLLVVAFALVFSTALRLLANPVPPYVPTLEELMAE